MVLFLRLAEIVEILPRFLMTNATNIKKILLADDDFVSLNLINRIALTIPGITTVMAKDGKMAYDLMSINHFDVGIFDYQMPEMDGIELLQKVGTLKPNMAVILCTANGDQTTIRKALEYGAFDFFEKPIQADIIKYTIELALEFKHVPKIKKQFDIKSRLENFPELHVDKTTETLFDRLGDSEKSDLLIGFKLQLTDQLKKIRDFLDDKNYKAIKGVAMQVNAAATSLGLSDLHLLATRLTKLGSNQRIEYPEIEQVFEKSYFDIQRKMKTLDRASGGKVKSHVESSKNKV